MGLFTSFILHGKTLEANIPHPRGSNPSFLLGDKFISGEDSLNISIKFFFLLIMLGALRNVAMPFLSGFLILFTHLTSQPYTHFIDNTESAFILLYQVSLFGRDLGWMLSSQHSRDLSTKIVA